MQAHSLYIHIPFCRHRCAYCDFNTYAGQEKTIPAYVDALCREIDFIGTNIDTKLTLGTIFFGGGTPSLLAPHHYELILRSVADHFHLPSPEITLEANPGTVSLEVFQELRSLGITRVSLGAQSAIPAELRLLERTHTYFDVIKAVNWARRAGFDNLNLDLIYGIPGQNRNNWSATVNLILGLAPEHLSLYALTIEPGTLFGSWTARGLLPALDPDLAADMYEWAAETLESSGYQQYEISNWAKPGFECHHNMQYWRGLPYLAVGAGAHGYVNGYRHSNVLSIKTYNDRLLTRSSKDSIDLEKFPFPLTPATVAHHRQTQQEDMSEFMLTGLRLTQEGVSARTFQARFGQEMDKVFGKEIQGLVQQGLLSWKDDRLRLTQRGRLLGNQVFSRFVP